MSQGFGMLILSDPQSYPSTPASKAQFQFARPYGAAWGNSLRHNCGSASVIPSPQHCIE